VKHLGDLSTRTWHDLISLRIIAAVAVLTALATLSPMGIMGSHGDVFDRSNLMAWNIIPYDSMHRTPIERAEMLRRLGISRMGIDWRPKDIPNFDKEISTLRKNHIAIEGFWVRGDMYPERDKPTSADGSLAVVFSTLKRNGLRTQIWDPFDADQKFMSLSEPERLTRAVEAVRYVATQAQQIHCTVAIYAHGGWMGKPDNELKVLQKLPMPNVSIVYDFEHGQPQLDRFPEFFPRLVPHVSAVILYGMRSDGPPLTTVGDGDRDLEMLKVIRESSYRGPIGIINHDENRDAEIGLRLNMDGLKKMLRELGDESALATYQ
jgi:hypothetical protein